MLKYKTPGVYREEVFIGKPSPLRTGVPAFLGLTKKSPGISPDLESLLVTRWPEFEEQFGEPLADGSLSKAVRGFFENSGRLCYVISLTDGSRQSLEDGLKLLESVDTIDLVCAPDIVQLHRDDLEEVVAMQNVVLKHCDDMGDRFAILDSLFGATTKVVVVQRRGLFSQRGNGALYYPWVQMQGVQGFVPPCGHVAGIYARTDERVGVYKAPANEPLEGVADIEVDVSRVEQEVLNPEQVNCLRAFPGRGIRVWGARALSIDAAGWEYINVRRLLLTVGRWVARNMKHIIYETNDHSLWQRVRRDLRGYLNSLFVQGALKGSAQEEAFFVKCDGEINTPELRDSGILVAEVGVAPSVPNEFIEVRLVFSDTGVHVA